MWNLTYVNKTCYSQDKFREHKTHINKVISARSYIDTTCPYVPLFLLNKNNKTQNEINKNIKINYENRNLLNKIDVIEKKPSQYHPLNIKVTKCPAYIKTDFVKNKRMLNIDNENMVNFNIFLKVN